MELCPQLPYTSARVTAEVVSPVTLVPVARGLSTFPLSLLEMVNQDDPRGGYSEKWVLLFLQFSSCGGEARWCFQVVTITE